MQKISTIGIVGVLLTFGSVGMMAGYGLCSSQHDLAEPAAASIPASVRLAEDVAWCEGDPDAPTRVAFTVGGVMGIADVYKVSNGVAYVRNWRPVVRTVRGAAISQG
jgi:hypothetical protein